MLLALFNMISRNSGKVCSYELQEKYATAKKELLKIKDAGKSNDKFKRAKEHITHKKPTPLAN